MSNKPKRQLPEQVVHLTRRTTHRKFMLRLASKPASSSDTYGKAALDHAQQACVAVCLSNHTTSTQIDRCGQRSRFMQQFHSNTARKRNLQFDHRENFWAPVEPGDMVCLDMDAIIEKILYTCLQPVAAGLVDKCDSGPVSKS